MPHREIVEMVLAERYVQIEDTFRVIEIRRKCGSVNQTSVLSTDIKKEYERKKDEQQEKIEF